MISGTPLITPPTISNRLGAASLLTIAGALLLAISALSLITFFSQRLSLLEESRVEAKIVADNIAAALLFEDRAAALETLRTALTSPTLNQVAALWPNGQTFVNATARDSTPVTAPLLLEPPGYVFSWEYLELMLPVQHQGRIVGHVYLQKRLAGLYRHTLTYTASALGVGLLSMLLAWLVMSRVQKNVIDMEKGLLALAHIDPVSQLWNRNTFNAHLRELLATASPGDKIALLIFDLDNFKTINDKIGHHFGDELLRIVGHRLAHFLGDHDLACRLGGDEFALVLRNPDPAALPRLTDSITRLFAHPITLERQELYVTCSIGVSIYPDDAEDQSSLIRNADTAMYQAKSAGKNVAAFFSAQMRQQLNRRAALESGLRQALERNELSLHYQPQFDLASGALVGAEVLLRWHCPTLGTVSPVEFIPIAEDTGLIVALGDWVLQRACCNLRDWQRAGLTLPMVSVNFSARQLRSAHLAQHILGIIAQSRVAPQHIEIELTESILMENLDKLTEDFSQLQQRGIHIAIDDFGTGYSSMAYLKRLPLDRIKIDRTFIQDLPHSANDREIVSAMVAMAHNLGLRVTAEGVETEAQANFMRELGCDTVQGYYFGKPMPVEQFEQMLLKEKVPQTN